ncbi:three-prime repair exonuclease 1-like [Pararge aegeria]|uniref:Three prime repair exonuclease 1 n=1 Tax=Pararge aegeria TaxID=116150 RepID=S4PLU4_9NEOP|nr:three-prime repair exonuclease 1-like [Pararge aegeria]
MTNIQTFVFFDLETTGIPASRTKVTEITLISVSRRDIEQADGENLPATNKLSLLCNPTTNIHPVASSLTGLTNHYLKNQPVFKDNIKCINAFLNKPKPVCLVAHNGNRFDFKILQAEYQTANEELPHDLLCIDSLNSFRSIFKNPNFCLNTTVHNYSTSSLDESDKLARNDEWQDLSIEEIQEIDELVVYFSHISSTPKKIKIVKKICEMQCPKKEKSLKASYKLSSVYEKLLNKKPKECHRAEVDCFMLLECVIATKYDFLSYADCKCKLISQV